MRVMEDVGDVELCASIMAGSLQRDAVVSIRYENRGAEGTCVGHICNDSEIGWKQDCVV